jgi:RNA polymerase sigma-70 factor (ECF subfamily)
VLSGIDRGETKWLEEAYRAHSERVFRICSKLGLGDRQWAEDRTHDVFLKLAEKGERDIDDVGAWLYRVSVNECFMALRRTRTSSRILAFLALAWDRSQPPAEAQVRARRDLSELASALAELPPKQRLVMVMVHLEGKSQAEAAELLGLSKGQVSKLHKKAMAALESHDWEVPHE